MRVAFVTPRYGLEVTGGAETAARMLAEHLVATLGWEVEAYSTCALDPVTWDDALRPGDDAVNGVTVHRFRAAGRSRAFYDLDGKVRLAPLEASREQSLRWVDLNGPVSPELVEAVLASRADVVCYYPYLYHPTVATIRRVSVPAVLHPAAHDEPSLYLKVFRGTYAAADALCYATAAERRLVQRVHPVADRPQIVLGLGVGEPSGSGRPGGQLLGIGDRPYLVSVGRVDEHKGSAMLARFFASYKDRHPSDLTLALVGQVVCEVPDRPDIVLTGAVDEAAKWDIVRGAVASVSPSALESFSLVVLEAWEAGVPVVVNAACAPTREHCERSAGGLWFGSYAQFEAVVDRLVADAGLRRRLATNGKAYVDRYYQWPALIARYGDFLGQVAARGRGPVGVL
ncbi:MAG TPA: glycosyltransferase family 4 protein [Acidimicrobiales bacterium]